MSDEIHETEREGRRSEWSGHSLLANTPGDRLPGIDAERLRRALPLEAVHDPLVDPRWTSETPITLPRLTALLEALPAGEWRFLEVWMTPPGPPQRAWLGLRMRHVETDVEGSAEHMGDILTLCDRVAAARFARVMAETQATGYDGRMLEVMLETAHGIVERAERAEKQAAGGGGGSEQGSERAGPDGHCSEPQRDPRGEDRGDGRPRWWLPGDPVA